MRNESKELRDEREGGILLTRVSNEGLQVVLIKKRNHEAYVKGPRRKKNKKRKLSS